MAFEFDENEFATEDELRGNNYPKPGQYHVRIVKWDDSFDKTEAIIAEFEVLAGTTPGQRGKKHTEFFPTSSPKGEDATKACRSRIASCAWAAGAYSLGDAKRLEASDMVGRDLVVAIFEKTHEGKKKSAIAFRDFWPVNHEDVADVPHGEVVEVDVPFDAADAVADL